MRVPDEIAGEPAPGHGSGEGLDRIIGRLIDGQLYGVLCTQGQGQPYGSLVAYAMTPDLVSAVFATQKATRKYRLLTDRHPYLDTFVRSESCGLFRIDIVRYFHVTRFQEVRQWVPARPA